MFFLCVFFLGGGGGGVAVLSKRRETARVSLYTFHNRNNWFSLISNCSELLTFVNHHTLFVY